MSHGQQTRKKDLFVEALLQLSEQNPLVINLFLKNSSAFALGKYFNS